MGGTLQYQVLVEPGMLRKYNLTLREVFDAVARNNANAGGHILENMPRSTSCADRVDPPASGH